MSGKGEQARRKQAKRKQKRALKQQRRSTLLPGRPRKKPPRLPLQMRKLLADTGKLKVQEAPLDWPAEDFLFWVAHGVNYLLSDYSTGTWSPMFEVIYESGTVPPQLSEVQKAVMARFGPDNGEWPPEGRAALAWTVQGLKPVYTFYLDAKRRVLAADDSGEDVEVLVRKPFFSPVWETFDFLKEQLATRSA